MGRPSNRDERYEQVMQALVRCVARYGLEGASLAQVATEAGLTRPLVRYHLGNRSEMTLALQAYVLDSFDSQTDALVEALPKADPGTALVELLFDDTCGTSPDMVLALAALTAKASGEVKLRDACRASVLNFEAAVAGALRGAYPQAGAGAVDACAHGVIALYYNVSSLRPLEMPATWSETARGLAVKLVRELEDYS
ncbi:transcriptional regulator BetI [Phaeobacter piscinae]|uniref:Transcriptional regulator BetI n=2 Tax=Phaeobacter piscinae TaxID=1580596 RepID=A0ABM6PAP5_9RHOB|nr:transcriptional regulator BetI [Phaeobacter piscinae]AUQ85288.1 transcriptional regulator BetI [Phaeobacter piscinae]AUR23172.1 transcriptional regulator BetI [Phaeobacter piscinae]